MKREPIDVNLSMKEVLLKGVMMERRVRVQGKNSTSAMISVPKKLIGNYIVILIPKKDSGELLNSLDL